MLLPLFIVSALTAAPALTPIPAESRQMVVSLSAGWDHAAALVSVFERSGPSAPWRLVMQPVPASLGRAGLAWGLGLHRNPGFPGGPFKKEGDGRSPAGVFTLPEATGYEAAAPAGTHLPYRQASATLRCVDDPASRYYNQIVDESDVAKDWNSAEDMRRSDDLYRLLVVVGHNQAPAAAGGGSCIFLHLRTTSAAVTAGCTAFDTVPMQQLLHRLDPRLHPVLVQMPRAEYEQRREAWQLPRVR
jgi:hypothetical protein